MALVYNLRPDFKHHDDRGCLVQLVHDGYKQINYIESGKGAIRGFHFHKYNSEIFYVIDGEFRLDVWTVNDKGQPNDNTYESYVYRKGDFFGINTYTAHVFSYHENTYLISMYDKGVEMVGDEKDIIKVSEEDYLKIRGEG